ncbi:MAG TPA: choice-of-anchor tandem repeat GloVer-containing protein, partial [Candidatus Nitrosotalea sp.]|nr:choice-of-anchor tandem repeat GloVer-containing protein [Candidatus Nitrosotalea sp.]
FNYVPDARSPLAGLVNVKGALYGTTVQGGKYGLGAVFRISASGAETVVYSFSGGPDGSYPHARLIDANGTLYGTTYYGGSGCGGAGCGTVYSVTTDGHETVLYTFRGGSDGSYPVAGLVFLNGTLYGTTAWGGNSNCKGYGCGTVYSVSASGVEQVLHRFSGGRDGAAPEADLVAVNGTLYGTTSGAGRRRGHSVGPGTAFALRP